MKNPPSKLSKGTPFLLAVRQLKRTAYLLIPLSALAQTSISVPPSESINFQPTTLDESVSRPAMPSRPSPSPSRSPQPSGKPNSQGPAPITVWPIRPPVNNSNSNRPAPLPQLATLIPLIQKTPQLQSRDGDDLTEAGFAHGGCASGECQQGLRPKLTALAEISNSAEETLLASGHPCAKKLLIAMRGVAQGYDQSNKFGGKCAFAVRTGLERAGLCDGPLGHAADMGPNLKKLGFQNSYKPGDTPEKAPSGAILVYGRAKAKGCTGLGAQFGHVEVKDSSGKFLYDGTAQKHIQKRHPPMCRPLIGVYLPGPQMQC